MLENLVTFLQTNIIPLGGIGIFLASIIEEVIAPIPSAFVLLTGGFLFLSGVSGLQFFFVFLLKIVVPAALGITIGSLFIYGLSYRFGKPFVQRFGGWFGFSWQDIEKAEERFSRGPKDEILIFILRAIPIIPSVVVAAASGFFRVNIRTYMVASFSGLLIRASLLAFVGWQLGNLYYKYAEIISRYENDALLLIILGLFLWILYRRKKHRDIINTNGQQ